MLRSLIIVGLCLAPASAWSAEFPYTAYVNADDVYVRSGPGKNYYPTTKLTRGAAVEVYRHDPGGWFAVRPPEGSFSWISAKYLEPSEGNLATVNGDRVAARVGSEFSDIRDSIQIRLERGEAVEIVETKRFGDGPAAQTWYKVSPPAGEFRWIQGQFLDVEPTAEKPRSAESRRNLLIPADPIESSDVEPKANDHNDEPLPPPVKRRSAFEVATPESDQSVRFAGADDSEGEPVSRADYRASASRDAVRPEPAAMRPREVTEQRSAMASLDAQLEQMELDLSTMVSEEPTVWQFDSLRGRAEELLAQSETAVERGRIRTLVSKIDRFQEIKERYDTIASVQAETDRRNAQLASRAGVTGNQWSDGRYDGVGRLAPLVSRQVGPAQFALLDESGQVVYYVTPAPGLNLRPYVGQTVGVHGSLSYASELNGRLVTVKRVTALDTPVAGGRR